MKQQLIEAVLDAIDALQDESADEGDRIWEAVQILETAYEESQE